MKSLLGVLAFIFFAIFGIAQIYAGYIGIQNGLGHFWAIVALIVAFWFRFSLPITIGSFFGAMNVWGWHWVFAAFFAIPGLLFILPGAIGFLISLVRR